MFSACLFNVTWTPCGIHAHSLESRLSPGKSQFLGVTWTEPGLSLDSTWSPNKSCKCSRGLQDCSSTNPTHKGSCHGIFKLRPGIYQSKMYLVVTEFLGMMRIFPLAFVFWPTASVSVLVDAVNMTATSVCKALNGTFRENG